MKRETMTPRERWLAVLQRKKPDRIPTDWWATKEVEEKIKSYLGADEMEEVFKKLHIDHPFTVFPRYIGPKIPEGYDIYGCRYKEVNYGEGVYYECISHPLGNFESVAEIEKNYRWPSVDWYDFKVIKKQIEGKEEYPIRGGGSEPFLVYKHLRGDTQAFIDLIENPEIVEYCLDKLFDFCYELTLRIYETIPGKVMITYVAEDFGCQEGLLYSPPR